MAGALGEPLAVIFGFAAEHAAGWGAALAPAAVGWAVGGAGAAADGVLVAAHCGALLIGKAG